MDHPLKKMNALALRLDEAIRTGFLNSLPLITMEINEMFYSIQGETRDVGVPTVFIRTQFCPLRCTYCDTKDSWKKGEGKTVTLLDIMDFVRRFPNAKVCITGGEPLKQLDHLMILCATLKLENRYVTIETGGGEVIERIRGLVDSVVMDWKSPSSGMRKMMNEANLISIRRQDQIKFVVATAEDHNDMVETLKWMIEHRLGGNDMTATGMPEILVGGIEGEVEGKNLGKKFFADWVKEAYREFPGLRFRFQVQIHKYIYGDVRGV